MKKTLLASAILASLVSVSAQAATVYDQDGTTLKVSGDAEIVAVSKDSVAGTVADDNYGSINLFGSSKVSDTVTAYGEFEIDTKDASADSFAVDELVVGLDTAYGDFSFGGTSTALGQISDFTDVGAYHGGIQEVVEGGGETGFAYANTFADLTVNAEFIASDVKDEDSIGVSAVYSVNGLSLGLGYVTVDESNELAFAVSYAAGDFYLGLGYAVGEVFETELNGTKYTFTEANDLTTLELAIQYQATDALTLTALVGQTEVEDTDVVDYYVVDASYALNDSFSTYVSFKADNIEGATDESEIVVGAAYGF